MQLIAKTLTLPNNIKINPGRALIQPYNIGWPAFLYTLTVGSIPFLLLARHSLFYLYIPTLQIIDLSIDDLYFLWGDNLKKEIRDVIIPVIEPVYQHVSLTDQRIEEIKQDAVNSEVR